MKYTLREYQKDAIDTTIKWLKSTTDPGLIEAFTGSGKSLIISEIAKTVTGMTGKKVLVLQPNKELLQQNAAKYRLTGEQCSLYSASAGSKSLRHNVVFATALTVKNQLEKFCGKFCLVILDEADASLTPTILGIIDSIKSKNPNLRVLGLTSSPYKMGQGYIYKIDVNDKPVPEDKAKDPFFTKQIVHISGRDLLAQGFVSPVIIGAINESYDTTALELNSMGKFTSQSVDRAFVGLGRKTSAIVADVISQSRDRRSVLFFAATHKHGEEILASLPPELSSIVTDKTTASEREKIVRDFTECRLKYLVNVQVFTRGTDFPKLDVIALLRATESSALLHQIIGRAVRIAPGKKDCLLLDYAGNIDNHHADGDLFNPVIKTWSDKKSDSVIIAKCELCQTENEFSARPNDEGYSYDSSGYFTDLNGERILTEHGAIPSHYGRRCMALHRQQDGSFEQCSYFWTFKKCPECGEKADISARYCVNKHELINPNDKLITDFRAMKKDPTRMQCDKVLSWSHHKTLSAAGNEVLKVDLITEYRSFSVWLQVRSSKTYFIKQYDALINATQGLELMPLSVTYKRNLKTSFYEVYAWNQKADECSA